MGGNKIAAYNQYLESLQVVGQMTGGRANDALIDILTPDQIDAKPTKLTDTEKDMIEHIDKIFLQGGKKFADLEEALTHIYNGQGIGLEIDLQVALSAYEKIALNQRITIKNRVLTAKSNAIQGLLVDMSNSLKEVNSIIAILERIAGEGAGEISLKENENIVVKIIDGGFDTDNPEFKNKVAWNWNQLNQTPPTNLGSSV